MLSTRFVRLLWMPLMLCGLTFAQPVSNTREMPTLSEFVEKRLAALPHEKGRPITLQKICPIDVDPLARRVFSEYGAVFIASDSVKMPPRCIFESESEVEMFQASLKIKKVAIGDFYIQLQASAAESLLNAAIEAGRAGKRITPLDGEIAGKRNYRDTVRIWNSRFFPALDHWVWEGKIARSDAEMAIRLPTRQQVAMVVRWEEAGFYFGAGLSYSIFNSVAPPGTSQHLSLIAFDVVEASDPTVRAIMYKYGWFQTIKADSPHFTFIGIAESELPKRGLRPHNDGGRTYWIPNVDR